jgi:hypothetical protein
VTTGVRGVFHMNGREDDKVVELMVKGWFLSFSWAFAKAPEVPGAMISMNFERRTAEV